MNSSTCLFRGRLLWSSACLLLSVSIALGDVLITEFMASNRTTLTALDGTTPDWIEIYNSDDASVSLHGLSLTTDPMHVETWPIPARTLGPRESVIVYASGEDGRVASDELHTDFKLSKSAGYLALLRESDDAVLSE